MIENIYLLYIQTKTKNLDNTYQLLSIIFLKNKRNWRVTGVRIKLFNRNLKIEEASKQTEKDNIQK